jgi:hypothetical protein
MRIHQIVIVLAAVAVVAAPLVACSGDDTTGATSSSSSSGDGGGSSSGSDTGASSSSGDTGASSSSGDTGASSSGSDTGASSSGGDAGALSCASYCAKIGSNAKAGTCTAGNTQYATNDQCLHVCGLLTLGAASDTGGDTIGCRQYHAGNTPAATHCPHAGPFGGDPVAGEVCVPAGDSGTGEACDVFCEIAQANCTGTNKQFADIPTCKAACAGFTNDATKTYGYGALPSGNTFNCRTYHLLAASTGVAADAVTHCPHIVPGSVVCQ